MNRDARGLHAGAVGRGGGRIGRGGRGGRPQVRPNFTDRQEAAQQVRAGKVEEVCVFITNSGFRSPADFMKEFFGNPKCKARQSGIYKRGGGFDELLEMMLQDHRGGQSDPTPEPLTRWLRQKAAQEFDGMINNKKLDSKLRYNKSRGTMQNLSDFRRIIKTHCPLVWGLVNHLATKEHLRRDEGLSEDNPESEAYCRLIPLTAIMSLVYARNQKVNAFQVLFAVFYYSHGLQKRAREILMKQGLMVSPSTSEVVMREMAIAVRERLRKRSRKVPQMISIDNVNQKVASLKIESRSSYYWVP
jgi:hypothetical protein